MIKELNKYIFLNVLGMLGLSFYILADTIFIANGMGAIGLTALNIALPVYNFIYGLGLMVAMGGATRYTLTKGKDVFSHCVVIVVIVSAIFILAEILFLHPIVTFLGGTERTFFYVAGYLRVTMLFTPLFMLNELFLCFMRNDGAPKLAMTAMVIGSLSNVLLDYVFIFPCKMGMTGAALATGAAPMVSIIIMIPHMLRKKTTFHLVRCKIKLRRIADICHLGIASFITETSTGIVMLVYNLLILSLAGDLGVAAYGIITNIALVVLSIFSGLSSGMQPLVSREYAKGNMEHVKKIRNHSMLVAVIIAGVIIFVMNFFATPIIRVFNTENIKSLTDMTKMGIHIYFVGYLFAAYNIVCAMYYNAMGKAKQSFAISLLRGLVLIIPVAILLANVFQMTGIYLSMPVTEFIVTIICTSFLLHDVVK